MMAKPLNFDFVISYLFSGVENEVTIVEGSSKKDLSVEVLRFRK